MKKLNLLTTAMIIASMLFAPMQAMATQAAVNSNCECFANKERLEKQLKEENQITLLDYEVMLFKVKCRVGNIPEKYKEGLKKAIFLGSKKKTEQIIILECSECGQLFVVPFGKEISNGSQAGTGTSTGGSSTGTSIGGGSSSGSTSPSKPSGGNTGGDSSSGDKPSGGDSSGGKPGDDTDNKPSENPGDNTGGDSGEQKPDEDNKPAPKPEDPKPPLKKYDTYDWISATKKVYNTSSQLPDMKIPEDVKFSVKIVDAAGKEISEAKNAGNYKLIFSYEVPAGYEPVEPMQIAFTIEKAKCNVASITFSGKEVTYNPNTDYGLYVEDLPEGLRLSHYLVNGKEVQDDYTVKNAGEYVIQPVFELTDAANYEIVGQVAEATLNIKKAVIDTDAIEFDGQTTLFDWNNLDGYPIMNVVGELPDGIKDIHYEVDGIKVGEDFVVDNPGEHKIEVFFTPEDAENYEVASKEAILNLEYGFDMVLESSQDDGQIVLTVGIANINTKITGISAINGKIVFDDTVLDYDRMEIVGSSWDDTDGMFAFNPDTGLFITSTKENPDIDWNNEEEEYWENVDFNIMVNEDGAVFKIYFNILDTTASNIEIGVENVDGASKLISPPEDEEISDEPLVAGRPTEVTVTTGEEQEEAKEKSSKVVASNLPEVETEARTDITTVTGAAVVVEG